MTVSDLISRLQMAQSKYGNLPVEIVTWWECDALDAGAVGCVEERRPHKLKRAVTVTRQTIRIAPDKEGLVTHAQPWTQLIDMLLEVF